MKTQIIDRLNKKCFELQNIYVKLQESNNIVFYQEQKKPLYKRNEKSIIISNEE